MTNFEYFKDELITIDFAINKNGKTIEFCQKDCKNCIFNELPNGNCCYKTKMQWLKQQYVEKPKLTKRERAFCESLNPELDLYFARDKDDSLYVFDKKPSKGQYCWKHVLGQTEKRRISSLFYPTFDFIKWTNEEPWKVSELLELEIES